MSRPKTKNTKAKVRDLKARKEVKGGYSGATQVNEGVLRFKPQPPNTPNP